MSLEIYNSYFEWMDINPTITYCYMDVRLESVIAFVHASPRMMLGILIRGKITENMVDPCTVRLCPELNDTVKAHLASGNAPFVPDTVLRYECNKGHELTDGRLELSCKMTGEWSGKAPNCTGKIGAI